MSTLGINGQRLIPAAIAVIAIGLAGVGLAVVNGGESLTSRSVPDVGLARPDTSRGRNDAAAGMRPRASFDVRDPFGPASGARRPAQPVIAARPEVPKNPTWVVSSILTQGSGRLAILNDAWVSVGDRVAGNARVTEIARKYVVLTDASGNRHVVSLKEGDL